MRLESIKPSHARSQRLERWLLKLQAYEFKLFIALATVMHMLTNSRFPVSLVAVEPSLSIYTSKISQAQSEGPVLSTVIQRLDTGNDKSTPSDQ